MQPHAETTAGEDQPVAVLAKRLGRHLPAQRADALLRAAGRGDQAAFATFFDRTAPVVLGWLRRTLRGRGEAERAVESAYVQLWRIAPRFAHRGGSAHARLLLTVFNELLRRRRTQREAKGTGRREDQKPAMR